MGEAIGSIFDVGGSVYQANKTKQAAEKGIKSMEKAQGISANAVEKARIALIDQFGDAYTTMSNGITDSIDQIISGQITTSEIIANTGSEVLKELAAGSSDALNAVRSGSESARNAFLGTSIMPTSRTAPAPAPAVAQAAPTSERDRLQAERTEETSTGGGFYNEARANLEDRRAEERTRRAEEAAGVEESRAARDFKTAEPEREAEWNERSDGKRRQQLLDRRNEIGNLNKLSHGNKVHVEELERIESELVGLDERHSRFVGSGDADSPATFGEAQAAFDDFGKPAGTTERMSSKFDKPRPTRNLNTVQGGFRAGARDVPIDQMPQERGFGGEPPPQEFGRVGEDQQPVIQMRRADGVPARYEPATQPGTPSYGLAGANLALEGGAEQAKGNIMSSALAAGGMIDSGFGRGYEEMAGGAEKMRDLYTPMRETGNRALDMEAAFSGALGPEAQAEAYQNFTESPGQKFMRERQEQALLRNATATGGLGGGNTKTALQEQAYGIAAQQMNKQIADLRSLRMGGQEAVANQARGELQAGGSMAEIAMKHGMSMGELARITGVNLANIDQTTGQLKAGYAERAGANLAGLEERRGLNEANIIGGGTAATASTLADVGFKQGDVQSTGSTNVANSLYGGAGTLSNIDMNLGTGLSNLTVGAGTEQAGYEQGKGTYDVAGSIGKTNALVGGLQSLGQTFGDYYKGGGGVPVQPATTPYGGGGGGGSGGYSSAIDTNII
jgi:hypothetical protein